MIRTIRLLLLTIVTFSLGGCGEKTKPTDIDPIFQDFLNGIPRKSFPINFSCGLPSELKFIGDFQKYRSFIPKSANWIFGTVESRNRSYHLIIYGYTGGDDVNPVLFSFNNRGQIIDSLNLILKPCNAGEKVIPHSLVVIDSGLAITLIDTTRLIHYPGYWKKLDYEDESMPDSTFVATGEYIIDSLRLSIQRYVVSSKGRFVKR